MDQQPGQQQPGGAPPQYSPDRQWWWDGQQWLPAALAAALRQPRRLPHQRWPFWLAVGLGVLLLGTCVAVGVAGSTSRTYNPNVSQQDIHRNQATPIPDTPPDVVAMPPVAPTPAASPAAQGADPGREICQASDGGGTYYLLDISETEHDLRACAGLPRYSDGDLDQLLDIPGMDRRCIVGSDAAIARNHALVGVYSDDKAANLTAARAYCQAEVGTADG